MRLRLTNDPAMEEGEVAERKRRGEDPADDNLNDETFEDAVEDEDDVADEPVSRGGTATLSKAKTEEADSPSKEKKPGRGPFARLGRFFREVVAELRKVIWPTRNELLTYTAVVIVFVAVMMTIVALLDFGFAKGVLAIFG
ncbi:preprotein translocase subunit SecE [Catenuloplanes nepalensis]|uniref:Protein translocase subunit SecE n=1 Tax=Catenuloplanes nepalensis TaxID=587533 RepID=A0ABT9N5Y4_9ACTN|nr:preprotein translocase subunit SecE [Catenuloplanes nepalensis]